MKIPYSEESELITVFVLVFSLVFSYVVITSIPDPRVYPVSPTLLWVMCDNYVRVVKIFTMSWPSAIPIWFVSIIYIIDSLMHWNDTIPVAVETSKNFDVREYLESKGLLEKYVKAKLMTKSQM